MYQGIDKGLIVEAPLSIGHPNARLNLGIQDFVSPLLSFIHRILCSGSTITGELARFGDLVRLPVDPG